MITVVTSRDANEEGLVRGEARERDEKARGTRKARDAERERETCTLRCTRKNERDTWLQREREPRTRERERERESTRRAVDVAQGVPLI